MTTTDSIPLHTTIDQPGLPPLPRVEDQTNPANAYPVASVAKPPVLKLFSAGLAFFTAGVNDGSLGVLVPYLLRHYCLGTGSIAWLYGAGFAGWVAVALAGAWIRECIGARAGIGAVLAVGAAMQVLGQAGRVWVC